MKGIGVVYRSGRVVFLQHRRGGISNVCTDLPQFNTIIIEPFKTDISNNKQIEIHRQYMLLYIDFICICE